MTTRKNPRALNSYDGWILQFDHPRKADFVWLGERWYSNFGGGVGLVKMRAPQTFPTKEAAETAAREVAIPNAIEDKGWKDYILGWD